jgi:hypothetical protein
LLNFCVSTPRWLLVCFGLWLNLTQCSVAQTPRFGTTWEVLASQTRIAGQPLIWNRHQTILLARDGQLLNIPMHEVSEPRQIDDRFSPYQATTIRSQLQTELGQGMEVTHTGNFVVAHAPGKATVWPDRLEHFYRSFVRYFQVREVPVSAPEFPLVAIVWENEADFQRAIALESKAGVQTLGCYQLGSNRVHLFDREPQKADAFWQANRATMIHEASHQIAFNCGIHSRWSPPSRWIVEGLGTVFEAPGVWDSATYPARSDRLNRERLRDYRNWQQTKRPAEAVAIMVQSDRPFQTNPIAAYAEAWALSFYLIECYPREYAAYLKKTTQRQPFSDYSAEERWEDFTAIFGNDVRLFDARFQRFMNEIE